MASSSDSSIGWSFRSSGNALYVEFTGGLAMQNSHEVFLALKPLAQAAKHDTIFFNLRNLERCDSAGLGVIVGLNSSFRSAKKTLVLLEPNAFLMKLFKLSKVDMLAKIEIGIAAESVIKSMSSQAESDDLAALMAA